MSESTVQPTPRAETNAETLDTAAGSTPRGVVVSLATWRKSLYDSIPLDGIIAGIVPGYVTPPWDPRAALFFQRHYQLYLQSVGRPRGRLLQFTRVAAAPSECPSQEDAGG
jgi:hypothetical protein